MSNATTRLARRSNVGLGVQPQRAESAHSDSDDDLDSIPARPADNHSGGIVSKVAASPGPALTSTRTVVRQRPATSIEKDVHKLEWEITGKPGTLNEFCIAKRMALADSGPDDEVLGAAKDTARKAVSDRDEESEPAPKRMRNTTTKAGGEDRQGADIAANRPARNTKTGKFAKPSTHKPVDVKGVAKKGQSSISGSDAHDDLSGTTTTGSGLFASPMSAIASPET